MTIKGTVTLCVLFQAVLLFSKPDATVSQVNIPEPKVPTRPYAGVSLRKRLSNSGIPQLRFTWVPPQSDRPILYYKVEHRSIVPGSSWIRTLVNDTQFVFGNLNVKATYEARVAAVSNVGTGPYGSTYRQTTYNVPVRVAYIEVARFTVENSPALFVSWKAPLSDAPIISYEMIYMVHGTNDWKTFSSSINGTAAVIPGLLPGIRYQVRIRAYSVLGNGEYGNSGIVKTFEAPAAIRTPLVSRIVYGGKPGLSVYWAQPESDHPITHYIVEYKEYTSAEWTSQTIDPTKRTAMVYNLKPGTNYNIRVSAVSDLGSGRSSASNKRTFRVPGRISEAATTPYLSNDKPGFHLIFIPPQSDLPILRYNIRYTLRGVNLWSMKTSTSPSVYLENLLPGNTYEIQINAESVIGSGNTYTFYQTTAKVPARPGGLVVLPTAEGGSSELRMFWDSPASDYPVRYYIVDYKSYTSIEWTSLSLVERFCVLSDLLPGTRYNVRVKAVSVIGSGDETPSTETTYKVPYTVRDLTTSGLLYNSKPAIKVTWSPPYSDVAIQYYTVKYRSVALGDLNWTTVAPTPSTDTLIQDLQPGTRYDVIVKTSSIVGEGDYSSTRSQETYRVPNRMYPNVQRELISSNNWRIHIFWNQPQTDSAILHYEMQYKVLKDDQWRRLTFQPLTFHTTIHSRVPLLNTIRIRAASILGPGLGLWED